ncbi:hypothetical protein AOL_s00079g205 [Orbilia oligospora ATCC 24927]|uniref:Uncharacterized protein n=2 Tax=Orbilia oligospora TaxID=2813651 RepID=G1XDA2_ARTOA|nr:hypothetical protein AOL_s00079g205 [Orbilia oligospora ATCC 24927]EGX48984.1 hypothetical protein AOL_s00079g205 [Orbilia oligospora ATCC 24927]KAF3284797.1 hypothetical protein TWF970_011080 [Orbilia oligospora]
MAEIKKSSEAAKETTKTTKNEPLNPEPKDSESSTEPTSTKARTVEDPEDPKSTPTSPIDSSFKEKEQTEKTPPSIATIDRMRAREDTPVQIDPRTIGKIRSPNFAQFKTGLGSISAKKVRKDLEMSGTPNHTPTKNRYAPAVEKADFELDICAKIGAIKWDSDDD